MALSQSTIEFLQKSLVSDLQVFAKPEWGSQNPSHRELIRTELAEVFSNTDLKTSVSHCEGMGVVVVSRSPLGVDVEVRAHVEEKIVARVSSNEEVLAAPSPASLWSAKEAIFKALRSYNQPSVVSKISVGAWKNIDSQTETYRLLHPEIHGSPSENRGVVMHFGEHTYSFFVFPS
ncbi:4'-phosphopantetheinyl transferase family protein [Bdellovibrio sp. BCCA]|uniref:4'-phosphopantetheinyl transferase family protein n=1 Tax=Bdellovibrio sp. BCCA TaxID=3136281 RepID=UPI0030F2FBB6